MSPAELELHFQEERINFEKTEAQEHKLEKELAVRKATAAAQRKSEAASHGHAQKLLESINRAKAAIVKQELAQTKEKLDTERETLKLEYKDGLHPLHPLSMEELLATLAPTAVPTLVPTADPTPKPTPKAEDDDLSAGQSALDDAVSRLQKAEAANGEEIGFRLKASMQPSEIKNQLLEGKGPAGAVQLGNKGPPRAVQQLGSGFRR